MECTLCHNTNPPDATRCSKCNTPLPLPGSSEMTLDGTDQGLSPPPSAKTPGGFSTPEIQDGATADGVTSDGVSGGTPSESASAAQGASGFQAALKPGSVLGGRYEIVKTLGQGGMGAVYKARDREVDRLVALKVIRPELAGHPDIINRFKQELILARQVTHKNVIRIFDLSEAQGLKFITMEYVEGRDLSSMLQERKKLAPEDAATIVEQVCRALDAAHSEGVVHRDLKPQNIMVDRQGHVKVMDFGIARSMELPGMTQTGALVGTPQYMSPEQAKGEDVDGRSDLFTLGIIFYELLTGKTPFKASTAVAMLLARTRDRAVPPAKEDPTVPPYLSNVVVKCLETDPKRRYQTAQEILKDLEARHGRRATTTTLRYPRFRIVEDFPTKWIAPGLAVILLLAIMAFRASIFGPSVKPKPAGPAISLAILPFRNASGDPKLDWLGSSLADMLSTDVGQSSSLRTVSSDSLNQILHDLRISPDSNFDPPTLRRIAEFTSADRLVWGKYAKLGDQIRIDATFQNLKEDRTAALKAEAPNEKALLQAVDQLADAIRKNLALSPSILKELQAQSFKPSSKSLEGLRYYNEGVQLLRQGKNLEAQKQLQASVQADPEFALAYSRLAQTNVNLGFDNEAEQLSRKAVDLSQYLPPPEKYRIVASHARIMKDYPKAIESYENLAKVSPDDTDVQFTLAALYEDTGAFEKARQHYAAVLKADPKSVETLWAMGGVELRSGNPQASLEPLSKGLSLSIQLGNDEKHALILQAMGIAYKMMNNPQEALRNYQQSLELQRRIGQKRGVAASLGEMGQVYSLLGKPDAALASLNEALKVQREIGAKKEAGDTLINLGNFYEDRGQHDQGLKMFMESLQIQSESGDVNYQGLCLNNIGDIYFEKGQYVDALTYFKQALDLRQKLKVPGDIAETVHNLAETNAKMGQYEQALAQYLQALDLYRNAGDKRSAAVDSNDMGTLFASQGRYSASLNSKQEALKTFRELQDRSPIMVEILSGYGGALAEAGRWDEAQKTLEEALSLARELKSQPLIAETLNFQGDCFFYQGNYKSARALYEQALQTASRAKDRDKLLASKIGLAKVAIKEGRSREAVSMLKGLAEEADSLGLKYLSVECSVDLAEVLVNSKDYSHARQELDRALSRSDKLGLRTLLAREHYLLATALRLGGSEAEAAGHYREALRWLDEIRKEAGSEKVVGRADLNPVYTDSARWSQGKKG